MTCPTRPASNTVALAEGLTKAETVLSSSAAQACGRVVELSSEDARPFEAELEWSCGDSAGSRIKVSVGSATRICLFARELQVRVLNLSSQSNRVRATVVDGEVPTFNHWETRVRCSTDTPARLGIPPFSRSVRVYAVDPKNAARLLIRLLDGQGAVLSAHSGAIPEPGIVLGAAAAVEFQSPVACELRVIFALSV